MLVLVGCQLLLFLGHKLLDEPRLIVDLDALKATLDESPNEWFGWCSIVDQITVVIPSTTLQKDFQRIANTTALRLVDQIIQRSQTACGEAGCFDMPVNVSALLQTHRLITRYITMCCVVRSCYDIQVWYDIQAIHTNDCL
jgi:hypothetical protein